MTGASFLGRYDSEFAPRLFQRADGFRAIFSRLEARPTRAFRILETGSLRIPGNWRGDGQSTRLFDSFINHHDGVLITVDLDPAACALVRRYCSERTHAVCADSVRFLHDFAALARPDAAFDLVYLDSFDLDFAAPIPSAFHHIKEFMALPTLSRGALLAIDDNVDGVGKGQLVRDYLNNLGIQPVYDGYQMVWQLP